MRMVFLTIVVLCSALAAQAVLPPMLSVAPHFRTLDGLSYQFQGTGNNGQPIPDGPHLFGFSIWNDTGSSGAMLWSESQTVETEGGLGSVMLGASVPIPLDVFGVGGGDTTKALYLDITLDSESISPRTRLLPAPFARVAERLLGDVVTGPASLEIMDPGGLGDTVAFFGVSNTKAETVHLYLKSNGFADVSTSGMVLTDPNDDTTASYGKEDIVLNNIGSSGDDGVSVELGTDRTGAPGSYDARGRLTVSNIGSSGLDGVSVDLSTISTESGTELNRNGQLVISNIGSSGDDGVSVELSASSSDQGGSANRNGQLVISNIGSSGEDGVSVELKAGRDSSGDLETRMTYYGLIDDGGRPRTSKPKEIVVVGSKVKEVVRFYENANEDEVADRNYVRGRATGVRVHSPFRVVGAALPDTTPGYERLVDSSGTSMSFAKNNTDGTSTWLEARSDTGGSSSAVVYSDPGFGITKAGIISADASGSHLTVSNIGSSGEDGVSIDVGADSTTLRMNKHDLVEVLAATSSAHGHLTVSNIGSSGLDGVRAELGVGGGGGDTASGGGLVVSNIGSSGEDGVSVDLGTVRTVDPVGQLDARGHLTISNIGSSGLDGVSIDIGTGTTGGGGQPLNRNGQLVVSNIGSSGLDGVRFLVDPDGACMALTDSVGDSAVVITTKQLPGGPTRGSKLFVGDLSWDGDYDLTLDGSVGIGVSNPANILEVARNSATDPVADAWGTYSSRRWKKNISPINNALVTVGKLRGVEYDWKADGKHDIGLIAEEVGEVIPEVVAYEENGSDARSVDYARLVALLIEAVKELKAENVQLKSDLAQSETSSNDRLNTLQDQVTQLSSLIEQLVTSNENGTPSGGESVASAQQGSASRN